MRRRLLPLVLLTLLATALPAQLARADGDPGSDVLVHQSLFLEADAGISVSQQVRLDALLQAAKESGFPIRVAIVANRYDLGAVTPLWLKPRSYARFLGLELASAYTGRLLVVMPNGFGFNWPGHPMAPAYRALAHVPIRPRGDGLARAILGAVRSLAAAAGIKLPVSSQAPGAAAASPPQASSTGGRAAPRSSLDVLVTVVVLVLAIIVALAFLARRLLGGRTPPLLRLPERLRHPRPAFTVAGGVAVAAGAAVAALVALGTTGTAQSDALAHNPNLDPGTRLAGTAPDFTLTDELGRPTTLHAFRGKVVLLAFNDSECTTVCPLTTTAMLDAKAMLGKAGANIQLLGIDANPKATSLEDVLSYSQLHGMLHAWHFLTGSLAQLEHVWKTYGVQSEVLGGQIDHTPAVFVIDRQGRFAKLYMTQQSYAATGQLGQLLAEEASRLLPGRPGVHTEFSYAQIPGIPPTAAVKLDRAGGGSVRLGPGRAHLYLFFATWDQEVTGLTGHLDALNAYAASAATGKLPALTAVDEGSVEPSSAALERFLAGLPRPLSYPVAIDSSGRVADGYEVQGQPWYVLTSPAGRILWYSQVAGSGWLSGGALAAQVRAALARAPKAPGSAAAAQRALAGSPAPLAAVHRQADQLLGGESALASRIRALHGYPIVINVWGSWCGPCQAEFGLFASASARYGRRVAFLGADVNDDAGDARTFLSQHPVSYPSYQMAPAQLTPIVPAGVGDTPTTLFFNREGKLIYSHIGQYDSQGTLDSEIQTNALAG